MHAKATFTFWLTLSLYLVTLFTVSYVGVYLTYVAIPLLVVSGLVMKCSTPKSEHKKIIDESKSALYQASMATTDTLDEINNFLGDVNKSLSEHNQISSLVRERTAVYRDKRQALKLEKIPLEINIKYAKSPSEKKDIQQRIESIQQKIDSVNNSIEHIRHACELEVKVH